MLLLEGHLGSNFSAACDTATRKSVKYAKDFILQRNNIATSWNTRKQRIESEMRDKHQRHLLLHDTLLLNNVKPV